MTAAIPDAAAGAHHGAEADCPHDGTDRERDEDASRRRSSRSGSAPANAARMPATSGDAERRRRSSTRLRRTNRLAPLIEQQ